MRRLELSLVMVAVLCCPAVDGGLGIFGPPPVNRYFIASLAVSF